MQNIVDNLKITYALKRKNQEKTRKNKKQNKKIIKYTKTKQTNIHIVR